MKIQKREKMKNPESKYQNLILAKIIEDITNERKNRSGKQAIER